ncbi:uncharacterized protein LOC128549343 [Mercenaria mercenaria]|uniref:uncharacterized protein LOC128549343 n=1 Tax=Mercenaria mercenaria TaxID=6596 RepID=UPI00234E391C|nr:uncharacterized protein LOC128549343 [Mercenaria mercenaria]
MCRTCHASKTDIQRKYLEGQFQKRNAADHLEKVTLMEGLSKAGFKYWSKQWGINLRSPLLEIEDIDLSVCLVQDPMHILTEGLLVKELCLMLYDFIVFKRYFTISFLNNALNDFSHSYLVEKNKPEVISVDMLLNCRLNQTSASMITLCCVLPLVIGQKVQVGNGKWKTFLLLIQITLLATSPYATDDTASVLEQLIYTHNDNFISEYTKSPLTPKSHYLVHIPKQIQRFGPGRNHWVMRFEGKHLFFKNIKWKCFKNIALSMSMRHQLWMCWRQLRVNGKCSENFLYSGDSIANMEAVDSPLSLSGEGLFKDIKLACVFFVYCKRS